MKKIIGYAAVGIAGYLIGFYEMKYHVMKAMTKSYILDMEDQEQEEESKSESL